MRQSLVFALVVGLLLFGSSMASSQAQAGVQVKITIPTDGFITFSPKIKVQGTAQAPAGAKLDLVVVSVNGNM